jgi:26S proteasome regulatory subunit N12
MAVFVYCSSLLLYMIQHFLPFTGDILEIGAQWSIAVKDIPSFERYMAQLKCYYLDYR